MIQKKCAIQALSFFLQIWSLSLHLIDNFYFRDIGLGTGFKEKVSNFLEDWMHNSIKSFRHFLQYWSLFPDLVTFFGVWHWNWWTITKFIKYHIRSVRWDWDWKYRYDFLFKEYLVHTCIGSDAYVVFITSGLNGDFSAPAIRMH